MSQIRKKREGSPGLVWWHAAALLSLVIGIICLFIYYFDKEPVPDPWYGEYIDKAINGLDNYIKPPVPAGDPSGHTPEPQNDPASVGNGYYYSFLTDDEKELYTAMCDVLSRIQGSYEFTAPVTIESLDRIMTAVSYDHPEYYWAPEFRYYYGGNNMVTSIEYDLKGDEAETLKRIDDTADSIIANMPRNSAYDSYKYIYQYITDNTKYNSAVNGQQVTSVLFDHESVCAGYSKTFQLLCQRAGLECVYVSGKIPSSDIYGDTHAWNLIVIDGKYYWSDVTWGDPVVPGSEENVQTLYYFCTSDRFFKAEHMASETIGTYDSLPVTYPECTDNSYEYCILNNIFFETYDPEQVKSRFISLASEGNKRIELQFGSKEEMDAAMADLIDAGMVYSYCNEAGLDTSTYSYSVYDYLNILAIILP